MGGKEDVLQWDEVCHSYQDLGRHHTMEVRQGFPLKDASNMQRTLDKECSPALMAV